MKLLKFSNLSRFSRVKHFVSTREGGDSEKPFDELNLALHVGDDDVAVLKNRKKLAKALGEQGGKFVYLKQAAGAKVKVVLAKHRGKGAKKYSDAISGFDALITKTAGVFIVVQVADCVPILLFDPKNKVIAVVHAGWRGTMKEVTEKTVRKMKKEFGCDPEEIIAGVGPAIGPCCFEVQENVYHLANIIYSAREAVVIQRGKKTFADLWQANKLQLLRAGLLEANIEISEKCTACNTDEFFSARKEGKTGRFEAGIMLKR